ncbi:MAG: Tad domain-containing protein, partial [Micromonosporaceae bacterium]|nr:Tad domain-containing protein [Micromonosporaceae bacterium]
MGVIVAILCGLGVVLPAAALVVDVGAIYVESEELTSGADAAAMVVAKDCLAGNCTADQLTAQLAKAESNAGANAKDGRTSVTELCGNWGDLPACTTPAKTNLSVCVGDPPTGEYVEVRVRTETEDGGTLLPPVFARTFVGNETYDGVSVGGCARVAANDVGVTADEATYTHTFNPTDSGKATATITADRPLIPGEEQAFSLVSYTAPASTFETPQYVYDYETKVIDSDTRTLTFEIDVPACYNQVDFVFGSEIVNPLTYIAYGYKKVGEKAEPGSRSKGPAAWYNGGNKT